eukprot:SAG31_NODE_89_length_26711_cov_24.949459_22_plen_129_part_00
MAVALFRPLTEGLAPYFLALALLVSLAACVKLRSEGISVMVGILAVVVLVLASIIGYQQLGLVPVVTLYTFGLSTLGLWYGEWLRRANKLHYTEETFVDPLKGNQRHPFPSVLDPPSVDLSLVVPVRL